MSACLHFIVCSYSSLSLSRLLFNSNCLCDVNILTDYLSTDAYLNFSCILTNFLCAVQQKRLKWRYFFNGIFTKCSFSLFFNHIECLGCFFESTCIFWERSIYAKSGHSQSIFHFNCMLQVFDIESLMALLRIRLNHLWRMPSISFVLLCTFIYGQKLTRAWMNFSFLWLLSIWWWWKY